MKLKSLLIALFILFSLNGSGQQNRGWEPWNFLIGTWEGTGKGEPGKGRGTFSFSYDLDQNILVRKSHSEYPATVQKPKTVHDDLIIIYPDSTGVPSKAIYFDNEKHVIHYSVTYHDESIIFTSKKSGNTPIFRLTYTPLKEGKINTLFEWSQNGTTFMTYVEGNSTRVE
ncbi:MAG TPA: hypothetical protein PKN44_07540 [Bacteroidales bacterium]|nr:hypothetical protein [Bacteroidales bacterium]HPS51409.1 hypothetical protein [Bacteroidales bacterium]